MESKASPSWADLFRAVTNGRNRQSIGPVDWPGHTILSKRSSIPYPCRDFPLPIESPFLTRGIRMENHAEQFSV
jgi:hypothetical protein